MPEPGVFIDLLRQLEAEHHRVQAEHARLLAAVGNAHPVASAPASDDAAAMPAERPFYVAVENADWTGAVAELGICCGVQEPKELERLFYSLYQAAKVPSNMQPPPGTSSFTQSEEPAQEANPSKRQRRASHRVLDMIAQGKGEDRMPKCQEMPYAWAVAMSRYMEQHPAFESVMGVVILANSIALGAQSQIELHGPIPLWMEAMESLFLCIYIVELAIRLMARGRKCWSDRWFVFDLFLVVVGCTYTWGIEVYLDMKPKGNVFQQVLLLRTMRLLRLLRALRMVSMLKDAWRLVYGLMISGRTMISTTALLFVMLYMFACVGMEVITKDETLQHVEGIDQNFGSMFAIMLTLLQFVTLDSVASIYVPLIQAKPALVLYFVPILLVISVALMNLVTAALVEGALSQAITDREQHKQALVQRVRKLGPEFKEAFQKLDRDRSGYIDLSEIENLDLSNVPELSSLLEDDDFERLMELFEVLDVDGSGQIDEEEFVEGLGSFCIAEFNHVPLETLMMFKLMRATKKKAFDMERTLCDVSKNTSRLMTRQPKPDGRPHNKWC